MLAWDDEPRPMEPSLSARLVGCFPQAMLLLHAFGNGLLTRQPDAGRGGRYALLFLALPLACTAKRRPNWPQALALLGLLVVFTALPLELHQLGRQVSTVFNVGN